MLKELIIKNNLNQKRFTFKLGNSTEQLVPNELQYQLDLEQLQIDEANSSRAFNFTFNINNFVTNPLFNITGQNSYETITNLRDFQFSDGIFRLDELEVMQQVDGKWGYTTKADTTCERLE